MKRLLCVVFALTCIFLSACGKGAVAEETQKHIDITVTVRQAFAVEEEEDYRLVGTQYYQGEPIQLWAERQCGYDENGNYWCNRDIYIQRLDGSRELLVEDISTFYIPHGMWWVDEKDRIFVLETEGIKALDRQGKEIFSTVTGENVNDICMLSDGTYILVLYYMNEMRLAELNPDTGEIDVLNTIFLSRGDTYVASDENELLIVDGTGVQKGNIEDGKKEYVFEWSGSSYVWSWNRVGDFCTKEDGSLEILFLNGMVETLKREQIAEGKTIITIRDLNFSSWMKEQIVEFNRTNTDYYVILQEQDSNIDLQTFRERTDMEIAAGKGADIIIFSAINDFYSLQQKGAFESLTPYLNKSDIDISDYFPNTFMYEKKDLYGINLLLHVRSMWMNADIVGGEELLNIDVLTALLQRHQGKEVFLEGYTSDQVLKLFLQGSDNLWGMIDWKRGTCDFDVELFKNLMAVAKRYGDAENNGYPSLAGMLWHLDFHCHASECLELKISGNKEVGWLFDDGCYSQVLFPDMVIMNANSKNKEGAWELIEFLLSKEAQRAYGANDVSTGFPVDKEVFCEIEKAMLQKEEDDVRDIFSFSEEQMESLKYELESAKPLPMRTKPILRIICEEAQEYFGGIKSMEEVIAVIENRVQLYLDEIN